MEIAEEKVKEFNLRGLEEEDLIRAIPRSGQQLLISALHYSSAGQELVRAIRSDAQPIIITDLHLPDAAQIESSNIGTLLRAVPFVIPANAPVNLFVLVHSQEKPRLGAEFRRLAETWRRETSGFSLTSQKYSHPAYKALLELGQEIVPLILAELQIRRGRWLHALNELVNEHENPTRPTQSYDEAVNAWLGWGKSKGFIS